jgi:hypothetical protein
MHLSRIGLHSSVIILNVTDSNYMTSGIKILNINPLKSSGYFMFLLL